MKEKERSWRNGMKIGAIALMLLLLVLGTTVGTVSAKEKRKDKKEDGNYTIQNFVTTDFTVSPTSGTMNTKFTFKASGTYWTLTSWTTSVFQVAIRADGFKKPTVTSSSWGNGDLFEYRPNAAYGPSWIFSRFWVSERGIESKYLNADAYPQTRGSYTHYFDAVNSPHVNSKTVKTTVS